MTLDKIQKAETSSFELSNGNKRKINRICTTIGKFEKAGENFNHENAFKNWLKSYENKRKDAKKEVLGKVVGRKATGVS